MFFFDKYEKFIYAYCQPTYIQQMVNVVITT